MEEIVKNQTAFIAMEGKVPDDIAIMLGKMLFEPTPLAKIVKKGVSGHCLDKSRFVYENENVQFQIKLCRKCGDYIYHYMTQVNYSPKVICTCEESESDYFGEVLVQLTQVILFEEVINELDEQFAFMFWSNRYNQVLDEIRQREFDRMTEWIQSVT